MNVYLIIYRGEASGIAIAQTGAKARYQMFAHLQDIWSKDAASFTDIRSRLLEKNVHDSRTWAPLAVKYTRWGMKDAHIQRTLRHANQQARLAEYDNAPLVVRYWERLAVACENALKEGES